MADIFSSARVVVAWLDESQDRLSELTTLISHTFGWEIQLLHPYQDSPLRKAMFGLSAHEYWSRLWVVQEFCLAKDIIIMLGADSCAVHELEFFFSQCPEYFRDIIPLLQLRQAFQAVNQSRNSSQIPFFEFFQSLGMRSCSDPRDRIFGLLSLFKGQFDYQADYTKNAEDIYLSILDYLVSSDEGRGLIHIFGLDDVEPQLRFLKEVLEVPPEARVERRKIYQSVIKLAISSEKQRKQGRKRKSDTLKAVEDTVETARRGRKRKSCTLEADEGDAGTARRSRKRKSAM